MSPCHVPTVLATRPMAGSQHFLHALARVSGPFTPLIAPAFETMATAEPLAQFDTAIFTSQAGPAFAPPGQGRRAYCVGDATSEAARAKGYAAISAKGDVQDLLNLILTDHPATRLMHLRGKKSVGDVTTHLRAAGLWAQDAVVYRKQKQPLAPDLAAQILQAGDLILPIFSAETVSLIAEWGIALRGSHIVAISGAVASAAKQFDPKTIIVAPTPDLSGMISATSALIA